MKDTSSLNLKSAIASLEDRTKGLELRFRNDKSKSILHEAEIATDEFANMMMVQAIAAGFRNTRFVRCPDDYYSWSLERRRMYLGAASVRHLMKSIVLENVRSSSENDQWRYVCCVIPYAFKVDAELLKKGVREHIAFLGEKVPASNGFNYRLVEDCVGVTGYTPNGVTPLGIATPMPVFVHESVMKLQPINFWLGGGEVSLKWKVDRDEFLKAFSSKTISCAVPDEEI